MNDQWPVVCIKLATGKNLPEKWKQVFLCYHSVNTFLYAVYTNAGSKTINNLFGHEAEVLLSGSLDWTKTESVKQWKIWKKYIKIAILFLFVYQGPTLLISTSNSYNCYRTDMVQSCLFVCFFCAAAEVELSQNNIYTKTRNS